MTTFVLIPGAGGQAFYWHRVVGELAARGHTAIAVDLPAADETAGLAEYADAVVAAVESAVGPEVGPDLVVVAQSMGGYTAPMICDRVPVGLLVLVNAMTPKPGETPGDWWGAVGQEEAARAAAVRDGRDPDAPFDPWEIFFHDVPDDVTEAAKAGPPPVQADAPFADPWPLKAWPDVPTRFLAGRDDRLFPLELQRRIVPERLGIEAEEIGGGHLVALSRPVELTERLVSLAR